MRSAVVAPAAVRPPAVRAPATLGARFALAVLLAAVAALAWASLAAAASGSQESAGGSRPVAHAVLFYSPTCAHCRELIQNGLPPILDHYGGSLQLLAVDAAAEPGTSLFRKAVARYDVPAFARGVPAMVIGDRFIAGTDSITTELPGLVDGRLRQGDVGWPALPGVAGLAASSGAVVSTPAELLAVTEGRPDGILDRLARDRWGNTAALIALAGMAAAVGLVLVRLIGRRRELDGPADEWGRGRRPAMAALIVAGLAVSGYLSYAAATGSRVLCGPSGSCDIVQHSSWARLLGVPVAYVGLTGYALIAVSFAVAVAASGRAAHAARLALLALTLAGVLFSLYLTTLEPFVLGATCLWCLGSAVTMTLLLLLSGERLGLVGRPAAEVADPAGRSHSGSGPRGRGSHAGSHAG